MSKLDQYRLTRQSYGIATAGNVFGGPRGVWLECKSCPESQKVIGPDPMALTDFEVSQIFRKAGWTGQGDAMFSARCPKCNKEPQP